MKGKVKNILKCSFITACIFVALVLAYKAIVGYLLINEERVNEDKEFYKVYGELFEENLQGFSGDERIVEEGKGIYIMMYSRQAHLAIELLLIMLVGMIVGAGIGYVNSEENIFNSNKMKMFIIYAIGVIILILVSYLYNNISGYENSNIKEAIIISKFPVLLYSFVYIISIIVKIVNSKKKKDMLNELLKESKK